MSLLLMGLGVQECPGPDCVVPYCSTQQLSTVNCQPSTVNCQPSTVNCQLSTVNRQLSTV